MADDNDVIYPLTGNDDLIAAGLLPEDDDDIRDDAAALLGIDVGSGSAPIDLDGGDDGGGAEPTLLATAIGNRLAPTAQMVPHVLVSVNLVSGLILMRSMRL